MEIMYVVRVKSRNYEIKSRYYEIKSRNYDFQLHLPKNCKIQLPIDPVVLSLFSD